jgi:alpha-D-ribose 1-methylphosphonate 5-triphosphate diphosphatase PhnM
MDDDLSDKEKIVHLFMTKIEDVAIHAYDEGLAKEGIAAVLTVIGLGIVMRFANVQQTHAALHDSLREAQNYNEKNSKLIKHLIGEKNDTTSTS